MSDELEKRLRAALDNPVDWTWADILTAARIGAEVEREECAALCIKERDRLAAHAKREPSGTAMMLACAIRARGGK